MGRRQLAEGKLDEASLTTQRMKSSTTVTWGLFEDSPDRLSIDIETCSTCGGAVRIIACIEDPVVI